MKLFTVARLYLRTGKITLLEILMGIMVERGKWQIRLRLLGVRKRGQELLMSISTV